MEILILNDPHLNTHRVTDGRVFSPKVRNSEAEKISQKLLISKSEDYYPSGNL